MTTAKYDDWLTDEAIDQIEMWARSGLRQEDLAHNMGISLSTLKDWIKKFPPISAAIKKGNLVADERVESALYRRAVGYDVNEKTYGMRKNDETGETELVVVKQVVKHVPPDTTAQIFWLKNRRPDRWRDRQPDLPSGDNEVVVTFDVDEEEDV